MTKIKFLKTKLFLLFIIPLTIFLVGFLASFYKIIMLDVHYTVVPVVHEIDSAIYTSGAKLYDGKIIKGEFVAKKENLGVVAIRIRNNNEENVSDNFKVFFKIREKGENEWQSVNSYSGGQFKELNLFPFGFNLISNSKNKNYVFEVSTKGANEKSALSVNQNRPIVTEYQIERSNLKNPSFALSYLKEKIVYAVKNLESIYSILVFFLPFVAYYYLLYEKNKKITPEFVKKIFFINFVHKYILPPVIRLLNVVFGFLYNIHLLDDKRKLESIPVFGVVLFMVIIGEIFIVTEINNLLLFIIILIWAILVAISRLRVESSFLLAVFFLVLTLFFFVFGFEDFAEKSAIWAYLFLVVGAFHMSFVFRASKIGVNTG